MSFGLLSGLLGGKTPVSNTENSYNSTSAQRAPSQASIDQFKNIYNAGVSQGFALANSNNQGSSTSSAPIHHQFSGNRDCGNIGSAAGSNDYRNESAGDRDFRSRFDGEFNQRFGGGSSGETSGAGSLGGLDGLLSAKAGLLGGGSSGGGSLGGLGGLLDAKANLLSGLLGGGSNGGSGIINGLLGNIKGSTDGSSSHGSSSLGGLGGLVGGAAQSVHGLAENLISATGLGPAFAPIDDAIIHPILWDPLSKITGVDVSKHPEGIPDVSDPHGIRS